MKITAKIVPYSSVVGSSLTLHADNNMTICQMSLLNVIPAGFKFTPELHRETSIKIAEFIAGAINNAAEFEADISSGRKLADANKNPPLKEQG